MMLRWAGHVSMTGRRVIRRTIQFQNLTGRCHLGDIDVDGNMTLK